MIRICPTHWNALRAAIDAAGMGHLVTADGALAQVLAAELRDEPHAFDPLLGALNMIFANSVRVYGIDVLMTADMTCPVCVAEKEDHEDWITPAVQGCLGYCRANGLLKEDAS